MNMKHTCMAALVLAVTSLASARGQNFTNVSSVLDGAGDRSSGGVYSNISAIAQPGGISVSSDGNMVNYAGFLNTFSLRPNLDTDGDGLADEVDPDNDGDSLTDVAEITGSGFQPATPTEVNLADSDADGTPDGAEAIAGTDPTDDTAQLEILAVQKVGTDVEVAWVARQGKNYAIRSNAGSHTNRPDVVEGFSTGNAASGPWLVTTNTFMDAGGAAEGEKTYAVEVMQN